MKKSRRKWSKSRGLPPGSLVYVGDEKGKIPRMVIIDYDEEKVWEKPAKNLDECRKISQGASTTTWINIDGLENKEILEDVGKKFNIHSLTLEDIMNTTQRPKTEPYADYIYIIVKMLYPGTDGISIEEEQISIILGKNYVITFQEREGDVFDPVRKRIKEGKGRIRKMGADYLMNTLLDAIVDSYFVILEKFDLRLDEMEKDLLEEQNPKIMNRLHSTKRELIGIRRALWPLREVVSSLEREKTPLIGEDVYFYMRDIYDHTIQVIDQVETFREMVSGLHDLYLSLASNRMNEIMKVLTIIATIFIPITFVAGVYGMNFQYMPELQYKWGYPAALGVMAAIVIVMLIYFKRKDWL